MQRFCCQHRSSRRTLGIAGALLCALGIAHAANAEPAANAASLLPASFARQEADRIALIERITPAVVCIYDTGRHGGGSGVLIDERGYGLTNYHVVAEMLETRRGLGGLSDGKTYELEVLGIDPGGDVAMFRLHGRETWPHAELGDAESLRVGDAVLALGNPFVLSEDETPTVTLGVVSGLHRYQWGAAGDTLLYSDCIQIDAAINPGNSGGPLFNEQGQVVGINGRISINMRGRVNVGLGYAITINQIRAFIPGLFAGLAVEHGNLQAVARDRDDAVTVTEMLEDGPAWNAGLRPGDTIVALDGHPVRSANEFTSILGTLPADWPVPIRFAHPDGLPETAVAVTEPIRTKIGEAFTPDEERPVVAARHVFDALPTTENAPNVINWRTNAPFATDGGLSANWSDDAVLRVHSGGRTLATWPTADADLADPAPKDFILALHTACNLAVNKEAVWTDFSWRHAGSSRLLHTTADGAIRESVVLHDCTASLSASRTLHLGIALETNALCRVQVDDQVARRTIAIDLPADWPVNDAEITVRINDNAYVLADPAEPDSPESRPRATDAAQTFTSAEFDPTALCADDALAGVARRVVKITGARIGSIEGHESGILVSSNGLVLTVDSALLDGDHVRAHLYDGILCRVSRVQADRDLQLALVRLQPENASSVPKNLPHFDLGAGPAPRVGEEVWAAGNPFKVAAGAELASFSRGVLAGRIPLNARHGVQDYSYRKDVLLLDAVTSTPGFAGGAVTDDDGRLLGMVGRAVQSRTTGTQLSYAIPAAVLAGFFTDTQSPATGSGDTSETETAAAGKIEHGIKFFELGYRSNPVYVERIRRRSPAARAGLRKGDLIIRANGSPVAKLAALERILADLRPGDTLELTIMRDEVVKTVSITLEAAE